MNSFQAGRARFIRWYDAGVSTVIRWLFLVIGLAALVILLASLVISLGSGLRAIAIFFLAPMLFVESVNLYVSYLRDHPEFLLSESLNTNVFNRLDFASQNVLAKWRKKDVADLFAAFAKVPQTQEVMLRLGLTESAFATLTIPLDEAATRQLVETAGKLDLNQKVISIYHFFAAALSSPAVQQLLSEDQLDQPTINVVLDCYARADRQRYLAKSFWLNHSSRTGGLGKGWAVSYTTLVDSLTTPVSPSVRRRTQIWPLFSRESVVDQMALELSKGAGQNLLLVGEPGIGKKELFFHFAKRLMFYQTKTDLDGKEPRLLNLQRLLATASSPASLQQTLDGLFGELKRSDNIVLFIDPIDQLLGGDKIGQTDISNVLQGQLGDERVHIIGAITPEAYLKIVKPNQLLAKEFSVIELSPPPTADLLPILLSHLNQFENRYRVFFTVEALDELIKLSSRYLKDVASPEREMNLLEEVAAATHAAGELIVSLEDVRSAVEKRAQVPLQVGEHEQDTLLNLEAKLHERVIGQNRAIKQVSDALLRARAGLTTGNRPIGTFLFLGPTGVGKTETAKALAAIYFGSAQKLIRLDMTEYADERGLEKLLGTDQTNDPGSLTVAIQQTPSAVVLFDEFEKASQTVKNVLLQLLDEGRLTTNYGKVLDFTNVIIIATSNAGSEFIKEQITAGTPIEQFEKQLVDKLMSDKVFSPELVNRFDGTIVFAPLTQSEIIQVVGLQIALLQAQLKKDKGIEIEIAPAVLSELAKRGYDPVFGARALERVIKNDLETVVARGIVTQQPKAGSKLTITSL